MARPPTRDPMGLHVPLLGCMRLLKRMHGMLCGRGLLRDLAVEPLNVTSLLGNADVIAARSMDLYGDQDHAVAIEAQQRIKLKLAGLGYHCLRSPPDPAANRPFQGSTHRGQA